LIELGGKALLNVRNNWGETVLHIAAKKKDAHTVKILWDHGAGAEAVDIDMRMPSYYVTASELDHDTRHTFEFLGLSYFLNHEERLGHCPTMNESNKIQ
jgi:hypothetical protein